MVLYTFFVVIILFIAFNVCQCEKVILYSRMNGRGSQYELTMYKNNTECIDLPEKWFTKVISINTANLCLVLYTETGCRGKDAAIYPGTDHGDLDKFGVGRKVKSLQVCEEQINHSSENRNTVLLYSDEEGMRLVNIFHCYNIEDSMVNTIFQIYNHGICIRYYSRRYCGRNSMLNVKYNESNYETETNFPEIRSIRSMDICPKLPTNLEGNPINRTIYNNSIITFPKNDDRLLTPAIITVITMSVIAALLGIGIVVGHVFHRKARRSFYERVLELEARNENVVSEFRNGNPKAFELISFENADTVYQATNLPYDSETFEISLKALKMDNKSPLGVGEFGIVIKATLTDAAKFPEPTVVAVKAVKPGADSGYVKALLDECKLMMYLQTTHHQHIVNLIGACTENLDKMEPYVVLEYCGTGSLERHLKNQRKTFVDLITNDQVILQEHHAEESLNNGSTNTIHLIRWCVQIVDGMKYLAAKKVIHGDLATRNVLLDNNLYAKISDFGLSRQLYQYSQYVKKQQTPLPWRWMAIESLEDLSFSTPSDVWAFGVTAWEIFSLAKLPYPGITWTDRFIQDLKGGYRMKRPKYATTEIHNLLLNCWKNSPKERPSFQELENRISTILNYIMNNKA